MPDPAALNRREFLRAAGSAGLAAAAGLRLPQAAFAAGNDRPNLVYVFADQHRRCSVGCYGDRQVRTPNMDKLAGQGMRLDAAISNTPICVPYRASLMTGMNTPHLNALSNSAPGFRPEVARTLGGMFKAAGYKCGYVGKWHLGPVNVDAGDRRRLGFDDYWAANVSEHRYYKWKYYTGSGEPVRGQGFYRPQMEADLALEWLRKVKDGPFCLFLSWGPPHNPWRAPKKYLAHYEGVTCPPKVPQEKRESVRPVLANYYGQIEGLDVELGRVVAELDGLGVADNTILVYAADHGEMMGTYGWWKKRRPHGEAMEVPFIARFPGRIKPKTTSEAIFCPHDILPTLAGLAGLKAPAGIDGRDLSGVLQGRADAATREHAYITFRTDRKYVPSWKGVRTRRYTYARTKDDPWVLFDQQEDPHETRNLVKDKPQVVKDLDALTMELARKNDNERY